MFRESSDGEHSLPTSEIIKQMRNVRFSQIQSDEKVQGKFLQGVTGRMFPEGSKCKRTILAVFSYMFVF